VQWYGGHLLVETGWCHGPNVLLDVQHLMGDIAALEARDGDLTLLNDLRRVLAADCIVDLAG